jgi:hypothetical protein
VVPVTQVGLDYGLLKANTQSWQKRPENRVYYYMPNDTGGNNGRHLVVSSEVETGNLTPNIGLAGQAYKIGSRYDTLRNTPVTLDYLLDAAITSGYIAYLTQDFERTGSKPVGTNAFHWAGLCELQNVGSNTSLGTVPGFSMSADVMWSRRGTPASGGTVGAPTGSQARHIWGVLVNYPIITLSGATVGGGGGTGYGAGTTIAVTGGTFSVQAKAHPVIVGGVITGIVVDTPGAYTVAPTGITITPVGGGSGATLTPVSITTQFYTNVDCNMEITANFTHKATADTKVRQSSHTYNYNFVGVDAAGWNDPLVAQPLTADTGFAYPPTFSTRKVTWQPILTYLSTNNDVDAPAPYANTPFLPLPVGGWSAAVVQGWNIAFEVNIPSFANTFYGELVMKNIHCDQP